MACALDAQIKGEMVEFVVTPQRLRARFDSPKNSAFGLVRKLMTTNGATPLLQMVHTPTLSDHSASGETDAQASAEVGLSELEGAAGTLTNALVASGCANVCVVGVVAPLRCFIQPDDRQVAKRRACHQPFRCTSRRHVLLPCDAHF